MIIIFDLVESLPTHRTNRRQSASFLPSSEYSKSVYHRHCTTYNQIYGFHHNVLILRNNANVSVSHQGEHMLVLLLIIQHDLLVGTDSRLSIDVVFSWPLNSSNHLLIGWLRPLFIKLCLPWILWWLPAVWELNPCWWYICELIMVLFLSQSSLIIRILISLCIYWKTWEEEASTTPNLLGPTQNQVTFLLWSSSRCYDTKGWKAEASWRKIKG